MTTAARFSSPLLASPSRRISVARSAHKLRVPSCLATPRRVSSRQIDSPALSQVVLEAALESDKVLPEDDFNKPDLPQAAPALSPMAAYMAEIGVEYDDPGIPYDPNEVIANINGVDMTEEQCVEICRRSGERAVLLFKAMEEASGDYDNSETWYGDSELLDGF